MQQLVREHHAVGARLAAAGTSDRRHHRHPGPVRGSGGAGRRQRPHRLPAPAAERLLQPVQLRRDTGQGGAHRLHRAGGGDRLQGQVLEHRRRGPAAGRRHGGGVHRRPTGPARLQPGAADDPLRHGRRGAVGAAAGGAQDPLQGRRRGHHPAAQLHHVLSDDDPGGRALEGPLERLPRLARHPRGGRVPDPAGPQPPPPGRADGGAGGAAGLVRDAADHPGLQHPGRRREPHGGPLRRCSPGRWRAWPGSARWAASTSR